MADPKPIRIMLVDDHAVVRGGLGAILRIYDDLEMVGEASSGEEALRLCPQVQPDVVLMDLIMPGMDGAATTRVLRERCPDVQVLVLTSFQEKDLIQGALDAGAIGYLLKNVSADELIAAIRKAYAGRPTLAPEAAQILALADRLEALAQAILDAPRDASALPALLQAHVPGMFPDSHIEIRLFPGRALLCRAGDGPPVDDRIWDWVRTTREPRVFAPGAPLPWDGQQPAGETLLVASIPGFEGGDPLGGIYIRQHRASELLASSSSLIQSLAAQIASAYHSAQVRAETREQQRIAQELMLAGRIQASLLPAGPPQLSGWQIAAALEPARETSGDFYDFIALPGGRWGIVVADVSDKGVGAALFMALSRTLLRTYAGEFPDRPGEVLAAVNARILSETRAGLFVTVFYAILDPATGTMIYANAGHPPPHILDPGPGRAPSLEPGAGSRTLARTGMALGVLETERWEQRTVTLGPQEVLLLYTDGVTDACNPQRTAFGVRRLLDVAQEDPRRSAPEIQAAILAALARFAGDEPQLDDVTLVVLGRDA